MVALALTSPIIMHTLVAKYIMETAGAMCAGSTTACNEMNSALCAMPVPKPLYG
jgi:hypothetical protein